MRKGQFVTNRELHKIKNLKNLKEVVPTKKGDLIVFDENFQGSFEVLVSFKEFMAITGYLATHPICKKVVTGKEFFNNFYN